MITNLATLLDLLRNALAVPGTFDTVYPDSGEDDLLLSLANGFSQAQIHGFFPDVELDLDTYDLVEGIDNAGGSLVIIYTKLAFLQSRLLTEKTRTKYAAGSVSAETEQAASVLKELLTQAQAEVKEIREQARLHGAGSAFYMADRYTAQVGGRRDFY